MEGRLMKRILCTITTPGRRGWSLLFFSFLYIVLGQSFYVIPKVNYDNFYIHINLMSLKYWGLLWIAVGVLCAIGAICKPLQPLAFGCASGLMCMWAGGFGLNWLVGHGHRSHVTFFIYLVSSAFILLISGWPEGGDLNKNDEG